MSGPSILHPAPYVPSQALAFADVDGTALLVSKSLALPVCVQNSAPITVSGNVAIANQAGGGIAISAASLPLPASAATAANQAAILSALQGATPAGGNLIGKVSTTFTASGLSPVTGSVSAGAQSGSFGPMPGRSFNLTLVPTGSGTNAAQVERQFTGDATWYQAVAPATVASLPNSFAWQEDEAGVTYRVNVLSGAFVVRISQ